MEDCLTTVARKQATTRFVKLHYEIAEMEHVTPPALLAYKNGDVFATIVDIFHQLPSGRDCSSSSLEDLLMQYVLLLSHLFILYNCLFYFNSIQLTNIFPLPDTEFSDRYSLYFTLLQRSFPFAVAIYPFFALLSHRMNPSDFTIEWTSSPAPRNAEFTPGKALVHWRTIFALLLIYPIPLGVKKRSRKRRKILATWPLIQGRYFGHSFT